MKRQKCAVKIIKYKLGSSKLETQRQKVKSSQVTPVGEVFMEFKSQSQKAVYISLKNEYSMLRQISISVQVITQGNESSNPCSHLFAIGGDDKPLCLTFCGHNHQRRQPMSYYQNKEPELNFFQKMCMTVSMI